MLEYSLCNELLADEGLSLSQQAQIAATLGYVGLEIAPATLGEAAHRLLPSQVAALRAEVEDAGQRVTGLHWLLSHLPQASVTDRSRWPQTHDVLAGLIDLCADLGGRVLVHGSPKQRLRPPGHSDAEVRALMAEFFAPLAAQAAARGVTYCIEPLAEADTLQRVAEGVALVDAIGLPAFQTMIDCSAAGQVEPPVAELIRTWAQSGKIGHIHANDTNRGAPGMGADPFHEILGALCEVHWPHPVGVEPFRLCHSAPVTAAIGIATLRAAERAARAAPMPTTGATT